MKRIIDLIKQNYKLVLSVLVLGLALGFFMGRPSKKAGNDATTQQVETHKHQIWTCSMHPQIRMDKPGKCPICGMDLIPLKDDHSDEKAISPDEIQMTEAAMKIADIQTLKVEKAHPDKEINLLGKVKPDERNIAELTARFGGRIEKLYVNFTGQNVNKGEKLATIYSPNLVTAQKELLEALEYKQSNPELYNAARNKLKLWDLTDGQIDNIEKKGEAQSYFDILSPIKGTVMRRNVALGDYVKEGSALFQVIDLTSVWVMFEAYESDLPWMKLGDKVDFTIQSLPGKTFTGKVSFIDPIIDPKTRIAQVRVEIQNPGLLLKPEMFANGTVTSSFAENTKDLLIPKTAVLWTGKRSVVYVKNPNVEQPTFRYREIVLGPVAGDSYVVNSGLQEGEEIAINGVFKIDAAAQLAGKSSMMNPDGGSGSTGGMAGMDMSGGSTKKSTMQMPEKTTEKPAEKVAAQPDPAFKPQLTAVYKSYLTMKNAFIKSDPKLVVKTANSVLSQLGNVDMELLKGDNHRVWMKQLGSLKDNLNKMIAKPEIESQREAFGKFNLTFYETIKGFGLAGTKTYYQHCPMAFEGKGAYWFSEYDSIQNPYYGDAMLGCGETTETLDYK